MRVRPCRASRSDGSRTMSFPVPFVSIRTTIGPELVFRACFSPTPVPRWMLDARCCSAFSAFPQVSGFIPHPSPFPVGRSMFGVLCISSGFRFHPSSFPVPRSPFPVRSWTLDVGRYLLFVICYLLLVIRYSLFVVWFSSPLTINQ
jgi:hypothetical protein